MLTFDEYGHLMPDQPIESTLEELEAVFTFNEHRKLIFNKLLDFFAEVGSLEISSFLGWIDGSFVNQKEIPRDADLVLFLDFTNVIKKIFPCSVKDIHRCWIYILLRFSRNICRKDFGLNPIAFNFYPYFRPAAISEKKDLFK